MKDAFKWFWDNRRKGRARDDFPRGLRTGTTGRRSFHFRVEGIKRGGSPGRYLAYATKADREDLLVADHLDLPRSVVEKVHAEIEAGDSGGRYPTIKIVTELPLGLSVPVAEEILTAILNGYRDRGYRAAGAIHGGPDQAPHAHLVIVNRPTGSAGEIILDGPGAINGSAAMKAERNRVAEIVNAVAKKHDIQLDGEWHGGGFIEHGVNRKPRKRIPYKLLAGASRAAQAEADGRAVSAAGADMKRAVERLIQSPPPAPPSRRRLALSGRALKKRVDDLMIEATATGAKAKALEKENTHLAGALAKAEALTQSEAARAEMMERELVLLEERVAAEAANDSGKPVTQGQKDRVVELLRHVRVSQPLLGIGFTNQGSANALIRMMEKARDKSKSAPQSDRRGQERN
jgi:hypothetical protein